VSINLSQVTKDQIKGLIIQIVKKEKPETTKLLIALMQQYYSIPPEQTAGMLIELENEGRLHLIRQKQAKPISVGEYIFSKQATWYWITLLVTIVTTIAVFTIIGNAIPLVYIRYALGIIFVLFLPGFALVKALFPEKVPIKTSSKNLDTIERAALSFGMTLALVPMVGLILNYTSWGVTLTTITLSLLALTTVFATAAIIRERPTKTNSTKQNVESHVIGA
jgi:uncharacterized membrane protein